VITEITGIYYLPLTLKYVENETIITGVYTDNDTIKIGDIIKSINGIQIKMIRDSLRQFVQGSNDPVIERNINGRLLVGQNEIVTLQLEDQEGLKSVDLSRNLNSSQYSELISKKDSIWKKLHSNQMVYGYIDMGRLVVDDLVSMFNDLWETDALIFDIRNYPNGTLWDMVRFLYESPINIAKFTVPDIHYPGTLYWFNEVIGTGDFSKTYKNPILILFDEETQSQAEYTVMGLEQHPKAVKIGSQTAAADGNVSIAYLPGGIVVYYTGLGTFYPDYTQTQRIGIIPDIEVHPTIEGIRSGRDEVLEAALDYPITGISKMSENPLSGFILDPNYPNPFNPETTIKFSLPQTAFVILKIYNILGEEVATLVSEKLAAGEYKFEWEAGNLASGIYLCRIHAGNYIGFRKMILLR